MSSKKDVFKNWREEQGVYSQLSIASMKKKFGKKNTSAMKRKFSSYLADVESFSGMFDPELSDFLKNHKILSGKKLEEQFLHLYDLLENGVQDFISYLSQNSFVSKHVNSHDNKRGINIVVKKYNNMIHILFAQDDGDKKDEFLFSVANLFFEFCFYPKTFPQFKKMLASTEFHPIIRLFYAVMWTNLGEVGWQHWHEGAISDLKKEAKSGKEIVYVAGGTDIYQLIKHGIYNIRVIDPILPSQPKYYSQNWDWFIRGSGKDFGVGEEMPVPVNGKKIIMKRVGVKMTGKSFKMQLSTNKKETIKESVTEWHLYDQRKLLGKVFFDRRLTNQDDFSFRPKKSLLISFNELYFIAAPKDNDGWGINPQKFDSRMKIIIKQLRKPVDRDIVCNLRHEIKQSKFAFISLGSCVD